MHLIAWGTNSTYYRTQKELLQKKIERYLTLLSLFMFISRDRSDLADRVLSFPQRISWIFSSALRTIEYHGGIRAVLAFLAFVLQSPSSRTSWHVKRLRLGFCKSAHK